MWPMITRIDRRPHTSTRWLVLHIVSDSLIKVLYSLLGKYIVFQRNREAGSTPRSIFQCFFENTRVSRCSQIDLFLSFQHRFYCLKLIWICLWVLCRSFSKQSIKTYKLREKQFYIWRERTGEKTSATSWGEIFFFLNLQVLRHHLLNDRYKTQRRIRISFKQWNLSRNNKNKSIWLHLDACVFKKKKWKFD